MIKFCSHCGMQHDCVATTDFNDYDISHMRANIAIHKLTKRVKSLEQDIDVALGARRCPKDIAEIKRLQSENEILLKIIQDVQDNLYALRHFSDATLEEIKKVLAAGGK